MTWFLLLPFFLGLAAVIQGVMNKQMAGEVNLTVTVLITALVFLFVSVVLFLANLWAPQMMPDFLKGPNLHWSQMKFWYFIPGLFGFLFVLGVPWSLQVNGPSKTFILLIVSQILLSFLFEKFYEGGSISTLKLVGAAVVAAGAVLVSLG